MTTDEEQLLREMWCAYTLHATPKPFNVREANVREAMAAVLAVVRAHDSASPTALANSGPKERQEAFDALKEELDDALAELAALRAHDRDAERMKWLADYMVEIEYEPTPEETVCIWLLMNKELRRERYETSDLRAAIDAAMRGEG